MEQGSRVARSGAPLPGVSQVGFLGSWCWNRLLRLLGVKTPTVLPVSRGQEGRFVQEAVALETLVEGLGEREDESRHGSHNLCRPGALVSIATVPRSGGRGGNRLRRVFGETPASSPRPGAAPPGLTWLPAPRSIGTRKHALD